MVSLGGGVSARKREPESRAWADRDDAHASRRRLQALGFHLDPYTAHSAGDWIFFVVVPGAARPSALHSDRAALCRHRPLTAEPTEPSCNSCPKACSAL